MWFIGNQDMVILIKDGFLERNGGFPFQFTVVKDERPSPTETVSSQRSSILVYYLSLLHSRDPDFWIYLRKPLFKIL
jgi:hypothetical protein